MAEHAFATLADYSDRYGSPTDPAAQTVLDDASDALHSAYMTRFGEPWVEGARPAFDMSACAVACAVAHRALAAPTEFQGASQFTQTAGPYSASLTYANPTGDIYLTRSDMKRLGLLGCRICSIEPRGGGAHG